jgi:hypothetical protein
MFGSTNIASDINGEHASTIDDENLLFVNEWLSAVTDHTVGILVSNICLVPKFSKIGLLQLKVDLAYFW